MGIIKENKLNTINLDGQEVYTNSIYELADEYINNRINKEDINKNYMLFNGMIKYIYNNLFRPTKNTIRYNNKATRLDLDNILEIDDIWQIYTDLCYKYSKKPTMLNFSILTGISMDTFHCWKTGKSRSVTSEHSETVKRWLKECEGILLDGAIESGNIGCMFALKANYGYVEQAQRIEVVGEQFDYRTREQIARQHGLSVKEIQAPEPLELSDD